MLDMGFFLAALTKGYDLVYKWGYLGIFLISFIQTASLSLFPLPTIVIIITFGRILNPFLVGLFGGLGSSLGALVVYTFGRGSKDIVEKRYGKELEKVGRRFNKHNGFWWIFVFNMIPFLSDSIIALFCGIVEYDLRNYILATLISKILFNLILAYAGFYSIDWIMGLFGL